MHVVQASTLHRAEDVRVFSKMARSLAAHGYRVTVVHPGGNIEGVDGVQFVGLELRGPRVWRLFAGGLKLWQACRRHNPDAVQFHDPELLPWAILWRLFGGVSVYDAHEDTRLNILHREWIPLPLRSLLGWVVAVFETAAAHSLSAIVAATEPIARRYHGGRVVLIRNYPEDIERFAAESVPWDEREEVAVYAGTIRNDRGYREMIEAVGLLPATRECKLVLAGRATNTVPSNAGATRGRDGRVEYIGELSRREVMRLMGRAKVGLQVIAPLPHFVDSLPLKIFEYMAAGTPVVVSDFPGWRKIVDTAGCGILVDPLSPPEIASAIKWLLEHPDQAEAMGKRGRAAAMKEYSWDVESQKLFTLYDEVLGSRDGRPQR